MLTISSNLRNKLIMYFLNSYHEDLIQRGSLPTCDLLWAGFNESECEQIQVLFGDFEDEPPELDSTKACEYLLLSCLLKSLETIEKNKILLNT